MAQPPVELPDPLNPPAVPAGQTDELLSQLAGSEIDRLLADAGVEDDKPKPPPAAAPAAAVSPEPATPPPPNSPVDDEPARPATSDPMDLDLPVVPPADPAAMGRELDQVFDRQVAGAVARPPPAAVPSVAEGVGTSPAASEPTPSPVEPAGAGTEAASHVAVAPAASTGPATTEAAAAESSSADEVKELLGRLAADDHAPAAAAQPVPAPSATPSESPGHERDGLLGKSDEPAANVPDAAVAPDGDHPGLTDRLLDRAADVLDPFPDGTRDWIGKVAIITAINAAAVLIYVLFFRH